MTALELHNELTARKVRGALHCQPPDLQTLIVTTAGGYVSSKSLEAGADVINRGGRLSDPAEIFPLFGFGGLPPWLETTNAHG